MSYAGSIKLTSEFTRLIGRFIDPALFLLGRIVRVGYSPGLIVAQDEGTEVNGRFLITDDTNGTNAGTVSIDNSGALVLTTGATNGDVIQTFCGDGGGNRISPFTLPQGQSLAMILEFSRSDANCRVAFGFGTPTAGDILSTPPSNAIGIRQKANDSNIYLFLRNAGTETEENTSLTQSAGAVATYVLYADRGRVILMKAGSENNPYQMVNLTNLPGVSAGLGFFAGIKTDSALARSLTIYNWQGFQVR